MQPLAVRRRYLTGVPVSTGKPHTLNLSPTRALSYGNEFHSAAAEKCFGEDGRSWPPPLTGIREEPCAAAVFEPASVEARGSSLETFVASVNNLCSVIQTVAISKDLRLSDCSSSYGSEGSRSNKCPGYSTSDNFGLTVMELL